MAVVARKLGLVAKTAPDNAFGLVSPDEEAVRDLARTSTQSFTDTLITPRLAAILLKMNKTNRSINRGQVHHFIKVLENGRWVNTGEPVILSCNGCLHEGQHRLTAIVESGIPAPLDVRFGVAANAMIVTGTGNRRTAGDVLHMNGFRSYPNNLAALLKLALAYKQGLPQGFMWRSGSDLILKAALEWPEAAEAQRIAANTLKSKYFRNAAVGCFFFFALRTRQEARATEFMDHLANHAAGAPAVIKQLHSRMTMDLTLRLGRQEVVVEKLALYIMAWAAWTAGERLTRLTWSPTRPFPVFEGLDLN